MIRQNRAAKQENLIWTLNPLILGWTNYHRHIGGDTNVSENGDGDLALSLAMGQASAPGKVSRLDHPPILASAGTMQALFCRTGSKDAIRQAGHGSAG